MEDGEGSASLVQEEHVDEVSGAKDANRDAKESGEVSRHQI